MPTLGLPRKRIASFYLLSKPHHLRRTAVLTACAVLVALLGPRVAIAGSAVLLPYPPPEAFGVIPASTYDERGQRVGDGAVLVEELEDGRVAVRLHGGYEEGARIELDAILVPVEVEGQRMLRISSERSQSHDPDGNPLVILEIDHDAGLARCTPPAGASGRVSEIELPSPDRVVNVPLNLLFRSIGLGQRRSVDTQAFFCLGGARVMGFTGEVVKPENESEVAGRVVREIRYGPDGKGLLSWAAQPFAPKISFWVDANGDAAYLAHRMPLYSRGPVVYFVADGVNPELVIER